MQSVFSLIFLTVSSAFAQNLSWILKIEISFTPSSAAWISIAVAAPPAPAIVIFFPITSMSLSLSACIKPIPSVICPVRTPFSFTIVFTAPQSSAAGESLSRYCPTTVLLGIDTFDPTSFNARIPFTASSSVSLSTSNARYA